MYASYLFSWFNISLVTKSLSRLQMNLRFVFFFHSFIETANYDKSVNHTEDIHFNNMKHEFFESITWNIFSFVCIHFSLSPMFLIFRI